MTSHWVVLPYWSCSEGNLLQPIRRATEDWHVISMEFLRPFLRRHFEKADGGVAKCRLFSQATNVFISHARLSFSNGNRHFYWYGDHIEFIRFKEYYGIPSGHEHDPIFSLSIYARFSNQFFFKFSWKKIVMGKKDCCAVFGCNNDRLFPEKYTVKFSFCPKGAGEYWASAPWASHNTP